MTFTEKFNSWWKINKYSSSLTEEYLNYLHETKTVGLKFQPMTYRSWAKDYFSAQLNDQKQA